MMNATFYVRDLGYTDLEAVYAIGNSEPGTGYIFVRSKETLKKFFEFKTKPIAECNLIWSKLVDYHSLLTLIDLEKEGI